MPHRPLRALLVGDRRFMRIDGQLYTEGPRGSETGECYLDLFDEVTVAGREGSDHGVRDRLNRLDAEHLQVTFLPNISGLGARIRCLAQVRQRLGELVDAADAVIVRLPTQLGIEAALVAADAGKPLAVDLGGCVLDDMLWHGSIRARLYARLAYRRTRQAVGLAGWVAYVTQEFLQSRYPAAPGARVVACSDVEIAEPSAELLEQRLARIAQRGSRPLVFGTVGSLHGRFKGVQHALAALQQAHPHLPPFEYRVLGGGDPQPWLALAAQHGLAQQAFFDGVVPAGEPVRQWLDGIDVYLQPSLREGLPRALIEAMSRGCPALASSVAGIPELLPREFLHPPADPACLARRLVMIADTRVQLESARRNWERAGDYTAAAIDAKRGQFWRDFRDAARALAQLGDGAHAAPPAPGGDA